MQSRGRLATNRDQYERGPKSTSEESLTVSEVSTRSDELGKPPMWGSNGVRRMDLAVLGSSGGGDAVWRVKILLQSGEN